ncbi:MAG TPA: rod shape-determining protein MreC [Candidatus Paceibacterota bacterium]|nr:rod shape-determining protein MreC [Candidatus Paceibacterota bacterium]
MITSFRHDRAARVRKRVRLAVLAGSVLLVFLVEAFFSGSLARLIAGAVRPFWVARDWTETRLGTFGAYLSSKDALARENAELKAALLRTAADSMTREALRAENVALKAALGRPHEYDMLLAAILVRPNRSPYDTLVIDIGADAGVVEGARVFADGEFVIGEVARVYGRSAVVSLYSSSGWQLPVLVGTSSIAAVAEGEGGGNFRILLPRGLDVVEGAVISLPSLGPEFTGIVERIERPESSSFQRIYFKLPFNIQELRFVYVALPSLDIENAASVESGAPEV